MRLDLTDNKRAILITTLRRLVDFHPQPLSPEIQALKAILEEIEFATESPLEGGGFESSVPRRGTRLFRSYPVDVFLSAGETKPTGDGPTVSVPPANATVMVRVASSQGKNLAIPRSAALARPVTLAWETSVALAGFALVLAVAIILDRRYEPPRASAARRRGR